MSLSPFPPPTPPNPPPPGGPYTPPYYAYPTAPWAGQSDPRAPAGRAGVLMIILGVLALLMGGCIGVMAALLPTLSDNPQFAQALEQFDTAGVSPALLMAINAGVTAGVGLAFVINGIVVRRGTAVPVILALALTSIVLLIQVLGTVVVAIGGQIPAAACNLVVIVLLVILVLMLIQAARNISTVAAMEAAYRSPVGWGYPPGAYPSPYPQPGPGQQPGYGYGSGAPQRPSAETQRPPPIESFEPRDHI